MSKYDELTETYNKWPAGTLFRTDTGRHLVKPVQDEVHHTESMLVDIFSGAIVHYAHFETLTPVYGSEIMW